MVPITEPAPAAIGDGDIEAAPNRTESGISWEVVTRGTGTQHPGRNDSVQVHYEGWTADGVSFDSSRKRGKPATFGVTKVIAGWTEALQLMVIGDRWRILVPADLAYGYTPHRPGAPSGDLTFDVELLDIVVAPEVPATVAAPPATATVTASGLAYRVIQKGIGTAHPTTADKVTVHYTGWMTNGDMFDSSVTRGKPATFGVTGVIKGWTEALQLMVVGDVMRLWIPADLAYGDTPRRPGAPAGMLVFDVELLAINP